MIPWVGGKGKLMWLINLLSPAGYDRFIDVFGGSATVTLNRPLKKGCLEIYNDFNSNLTNLFFCVKERPMALIRELGFLPLNSRDDFSVLEKFFNREEFTDDYLKEELELTQVYLEPPQREMIQRLMLERSPRGDVRRAADYFKLIRYSFSGGGKAFAGRSCDIRQFFHLVWECSRRLARVVIENKDCVDLIGQYDRPGALIYCDPPYYEAEDCYAVVFTEADHRRLHDALLACQGFVMLSYNDCAFIRGLYKEFYIFRTTRPNSMSQTAGSEYVEVLITNYDPRRFPRQFSMFGLPDGGSGAKYELIHEPAAAYGSSTQTVSATRAYPNLSGQDTSYIPKEITDNGQTLELASIDWQIDNTANEDGYAVADRYTAIATYTGTATSSYIKGYTVTADYSGTVSRIALNKVRYVAVFEGVPLTPVEPEPTPGPTPDTQVSAAPAIRFHWAYVLVPLGVIALAGAGVGAALFIKKRRESYDGEEDSDEA